IETPSENMVTNQVVTKDIDSPEPAESRTHRASLTRSWLQIAACYGVCRAFNHCRTFTVMKAVMMTAPITTIGDSPSDPPLPPGLQLEYLEPSTVGNLRLVVLPPSPELLPPPPMMIAAPATTIMITAIPI